MRSSRLLCTLVAGLTYALPGFCQDDDLLKLVGEEKPKKEFVKNAFKSSRVINGHSMEFIGKGVLDFRILHRFGTVNSGARNLFGLDQANMRMGFDYGVTRNLTVGIGRSNVNKELDGFIKFRPVWQSTGPGSFPVSVVLITGLTMHNMPWTDPTRRNYFSSRMGFYNIIIVGRKLTETFTLQLSPTFVHRNLVTNATDENDVYALGIGARMKLSKRVALVGDYHRIIKGLPDSAFSHPLSIGFDIETGGHVFQLHFSNSTGMNEKAFITSTSDKWGKGQIRFGFNLSRVFTIRKPKKA